MVAAAKLRRAQEAAEAARPYAERMGVVLANIAKSTAGNEGAPVLIAGTGEDNVRLLVVCTAERGLCGAFNSSIARLARDDARRLMADGKTVKILCVGKKGYDVLKREFASQILETIDFRSVRQMSFAEAQSVCDKVLTMYEDGEFDIATLYYSRFQSVITQIPTAQQIIPAEVPEEGEEEGGSGRCLRIRTRGRGDPCRSPATQRFGPDLPRIARKCRVRTGRANERHGQCDAQCGRDDRQADAELQPPAPGTNYQGTD